MQTMYPFWAGVISAVLAQALKPFFNYIKTHEWNWSLLKDSGGFPSSHSAMVAALALAVGIREQFSSTIFAVTLTVAVIVVYDAANVRYYSGQNIKITQQLVKDIHEKLNVDLDSPIYQTKVKNVLGHKWIEVIGGIILGMLVALIARFGI